MTQQSAMSEHDFEILRSMFSGTIHNIGNILTMANLAVNELEEANASESPPLIDMILDEMLPTLEGRVAAGKAQEFLGDDPQGREYLAAIRDLLEYQRKVIIKQRSTVESLASKLDHINKIIALQQQLLMGIGIQETITVDQIVDDALKMTGDSAQRHGIDVIRRLDPTVPVHLDVSTMTQVVINLLKNAIEAFEKVDDNRRKVIEIVTQTGKEGQAMCVVSDNGPGMSSEVQAKAFDFGFTTKDKTRGERGVGLHFCRQAVERFGGRIGMTSVPGKGSAFDIHLPHTDRKPKTAGKSGGKRKSAAGPGGKKETSRKRRQNTSSKSRSKSKS